jgi:hypothetical protein
MRRPTGRQNEREALATLRHVVDIGITLIDNAEAYGPFHNESLIALRAARRRPRPAHGGDRGDRGTRHARRPRAHERLMTRSNAPTMIADPQAIGLEA